MCFVCSASADVEVFEVRPCHEGAARVSCHAHPRQSSDSRLSADELRSQQLPSHCNISADIARKHLSVVLSLVHTFLHRLGCAPRTPRNDSIGRGAMLMSR